MAALPENRSKGEDLTFLTFVHSKAARGAYNLVVLNPTGRYFFPKRARSIILPNFLSIPAREVGMPVVRANFCFTCVTPKALFHENESPGIPVFVLLFTICSQQKQS